MATPIDPQGGCAGWRIPFRVNLGGIPCAIVVEEGLYGEGLYGDGLFGD